MANCDTDYQRICRHKIACLGHLDRFLIVAPVGATLLGFVYLLVVDRDKLQSEEFQIRKKTLEIFEQKGMATPLPFEPDIEIIPPIETRV